MARQPEPLQGSLVTGRFHDDWTGVRPMRAPETDFLGIASQESSLRARQLFLSERNGLSYEYFS